MMVNYCEKCHKNEIEEGIFYCPDCAFKKSKILIENAVNRKKGFLYWLDDKGNILRTKINEDGSSTGCIKVEEKIIKREKRLLYFIDKYGNVRGFDPSVTIKCLNCDYTWKPKNDKIPAKCPNCNGKIYSTNKDKRM